MPVPGRVFVRLFKGLLYPVVLTRPNTRIPRRLVVVVVARVFTRYAYALFPRTESVVGVEIARVFSVRARDFYPVFATHFI
jgi:hypothetical protein